MTSRQGAGELGTASTTSTTVPSFGHFSSAPPSMRKEPPMPTETSPERGSAPAFTPVEGHWNEANGEVAGLVALYCDKSRAELCHGELTDFALANRIYMADRSDLDLLAWRTAAKERIRWLSVQLAKARGEA